MPVKPASSTTVGASPRGSARPAGSKPAAGGDGLRARKTGGSSSAGGASRAARSIGNSASGGMWRFYSDDSPGIKVGPVPVLVFSLLFIASVFVLHIWGKFSRSSSSS